MIRNARALFCLGMLALTHVHEPALGAQRPHYRAQVVLKAIIDDASVSGTLRLEPIISIMQTAANQYRVESKTCKVDVRIVARPQPGPPPEDEGKFDVAIVTHGCQ